MKYLRTSFHLALSVISNERRLALRQAKNVSWLKPNNKTFNFVVLSVCNLCVISTTCHFFGRVIATSLTVFFRSASLLNFTVYRSLRFTSLYVNSTFCSVGLSVRNWQECWSSTSCILRPNCMQNWQLLKWSGTKLSNTSVQLLFQWRFQTPTFK